MTESDTTMPPPDDGRGNAAPPADGTTPGPDGHSQADSPAAGADASAEAAAVGDADELQALLEEREARYRRLAADFENYRRRSARDLGERSRYAAEGAALALIPVLDNLRRAVEAAPEGTPASLLEGLRYTVRQFEEALASVGITPVDSIGVPFDPSVHEAVMGEESPDVEVDTAVEELQKGWRLHERVLRPAMVKVAHPVASAPPSEVAAAGPEQGFDDV